MSGYICLYMPRRCAECDRPLDGKRMDGFCSDDCAADQAVTVARMDAEWARRRANEDAFGAECDRLRAQGLSDEEIDRQLAWWKT